MSEEQRHENHDVIALAMQRPDDYVIRMEYEDGKGKVTDRVVSPVAFLGQTHLRAMCLCREEVRSFILKRCRRVRLVPAHEVLMPEPIREMTDTQTLRPSTA